MSRTTCRVPPSRNGPSRGATISGDASQRDGETRSGLARCSAHHLRWVYEPARFAMRGCRHRLIGWASTIAFGLMMVVVPGLHGPRVAHDHHNWVTGPSLGVMAGICCGHHSPQRHSHQHADRHGSERSRDSHHPDDCPVCELLAKPVLPTTVVVLEAEAALAEETIECAPLRDVVAVLSVPPARGPPVTA